MVNYTTMEKDVRILFALFCFVFLVFFEKQDFRVNDMEPKHFDLMFWSKLNIL